MYTSQRKKNKNKIRVSMSPSPSTNFLDHFDQGVFPLWNCISQQTFMGKLGELCLSSEFIHFWDLWSVTKHVCKEKQNFSMNLHTLMHADHKNSHFEGNFPSSCVFFFLELICWVWQRAFRNLPLWGFLSALKYSLIWESIHHSTSKHSAQLPGCK